jgi:hypothetical protein
LSVGVLCCLIIFLGAGLGLFGPLWGLGLGPSFAQETAAAPLFFFAWGGAPHAEALLFWRDLALLLALANLAFLRPLKFFFVFFLGGGLWAAALGAVWALASTTPPLLWAGDGVELCTFLGLLVYIGWAHRWPLKGPNPGAT